MTGSGRPGATRRPHRYNVSPVTQPASDEWSVRTDGSDCLKPVPRVNHHQSGGQRPSLGVPCVPLQLTLIQWLIKCNHLLPCHPRPRSRPVPSPLHTFSLSDHNRTSRRYQLNCWITKIKFRISVTWKRRRFSLSKRCFGFATIVIKTL